MKTAEVRELTTKEILERIAEEKAFLVRQKIQHTVSELENPMIIRKTRKLIAKLNTEMRRRELIENPKR